MFKTSVQNAPHPSETEQLIANFHDAIATKFFQSVSFSLFAKHKLLFSTLMATRILTSRQMISKSELAFLLQPQVSPSADERIHFIPEEIWQLFPGLISSSPVFTRLIESIKEDEAAWKQYMESQEPEKAPVPLKQTLTPFQKLLLLRVFHLHRVREGLRVFVSETLGERFVSPPPLNLINVFQQSSPLAPLIFVITPGIDPVDEIMDVATTMELEKYLKFYALGRGRGKGAEELISDCAAQGFWLILQNCHLSLSWMPRLEYLIDNLDPKHVHERFRLCLVTMSDDRFPIGILYQST
jgi:hypothetical protein